MEPPLSAATIWRANARETRKTESLLVFITVCHASSGRSATAWRSSPRLAAALLTRIVAGPNVDAVKSASRCASDSTARSPSKAAALPPADWISSTTEWMPFQPERASSSGRRELLRPVTTTVQPDCASTTAVSRPIPRARAAPVTTAT
ncbi:unannotated protein [freshwater metagenome]|uniref:Unannotated protein n=1 Tax=freshwater metagenome TaxID=449393 RepID=A0A6J6RKA0_9ZZZZ